MTMTKEVDITMTTIHADEELIIDTIETAQSTPFANVEKVQINPKDNVVNQIGIDDKKGALPKKKQNQGQFEFPDGGWECSKCQNYNFKGRKECNRCKKARSKQDLSGKPLHLIKSEQKEASAGLKMQRGKMQKNGKFKNLKVDTNLFENASEQAQVESSVGTGYSKQGTLMLSNSVRE